MAAKRLLHFNHRILVSARFFFVFKVKEKKGNERNGGGIDGTPSLLSSHELLLSQRLYCSLIDRGMVCLFNFGFPEIESKKEDERIGSRECFGGGFGR